MKITDMLPDVSLCVGGPDVGPGAHQVVHYQLLVWIFIHLQSREQRTAQIHIIIIK